MIYKRALIGFIIILSLHISRPCGAALIRPDIMYQGDISEILIKDGIKGVPELYWLGHKVYLKRYERYWLGFIGVDISHPEGYEILSLSYPHSDKVHKYRIRIAHKDYGKRVLRLPRQMVELKGKILKRVLKEKKILKELWNTVSFEPLWDIPFIYPVEGEVVCGFGKRSIINGKQRSPHSGVDFRARKGEPVRAINRGVVIFCGELFLEGKSIVLDHGGGLKSIYIHLDRILKKKGQSVRKGEIIGLAGASGRVTGAHLHLGIKWYDLRVDPMALIKESTRIEKEIDIK